MERNLLALHFISFVELKNGRGMIARLIKLNPNSKFEIA